MLEISKTSVETISVNAIDGTLKESFNPDARKTFERVEASEERTEGFNPDNRKSLDIKPNDDGYYTTEKERIDKTPKENSNKGEWTGEPGNSKFIPNDPSIKEKMKEKGVDGIAYNHGDVDFSKFSKGSVEIDNMTGRRLGPGGNFEQCDEKFAEKFNQEGKNGKTDWTARDVADYIKESHLTRHECCDCKTMQLVDEAVHRYFSHSGGCNECKHRDGRIGGGFDA